MVKQTLITQAQIINMEQRYRNHFVNSLSGFKSANLVGTQDNSGQTNLSIVSSVFHLGANPALMGLIIRPHSVPRHTFENIKQLGFYTLNQVSHEFYQQAHQTSARYEKEVTEFSATGLEPEYIADFVAPFVKQSKLKIGLKLVEHQTLACNGTELIVGEIQCVLIEPNAIDEDGFVCLQQLNTVAVNGLDGYSAPQKSTRMSYAKPDKAPSILK